MKGTYSYGSLALLSSCTCLSNNETKFIKWHFANTCRRLHSGSTCVAAVATSLTRDDLGSGHSRSFWHSDLRNLSVIPHFEGSTTLVFHGSFAQITALAVWLTWALRSRPTGESVIPAPDRFREREVFTSNKVGTSSNLICSTYCMLTRANVHFKHELGLHPTWLQHLPQAHSSSSSLRTWVGTSSNLIAALAASSLELMFTSNMSWDFIQL